MVFILTYCIVRRVVGRVSGVCVLLFLLLPSAAMSCGANGGAADGSCSATDVGSTSNATPNSSTSNPINLITGNKYQREIDHAPRLTALNHDLVLVRHYNSNNHKIDSGLGPGWSLSYHVRLGRSSNEERQIVQSDGRRIVFTRNADHAVARFDAVNPADGYLDEHTDKRSWHMRDGRRLYFDDQGRLLRILSPTGEPLTLHYSRRGRLTAVSDAAERRLRFYYYARPGLEQYTPDADPQVTAQRRAQRHAAIGRLKRIVLPDGGELHYRYDAAGNLIEARYPDDSVRRYHYEDPRFPHALTAITDARGVRYAHWGYDANGRANLGEHAGGVERVTLDYHLPNKKGGIGETVLTNSLGQQSRYTWRLAGHNAQSLLLSSTGPGCATCPPTNQRYDYNDHYQVTAIHHKNGTTTRYVYDDTGRTVNINEKTKQGDIRSLVRYDYDGDLNKPSRILRPSLNPNGEQSVTLRYNAQGQITQRHERGYSPNTAGGFDVIERRTTLRYQGSDLVAIDGPRDDVNDTTSLTWDKQHRLTQLTTPDGRTLRVLDYDRYGRPITLQNGRQTPIALAYTPRGNVTRVQQGKRQVEYRYDPTGRLIAITDPDGKTLTLSYDDAGRVTELTDPDGRHVTVELNDESQPQRRRLMSTDGTVLSTVSYLYDAQGRLNAVDQNGQHTQYAYDDQDRLTQITDAQDNTTQLSYSALGHVLSLTQPGNVVTQFGYDNQQQLNRVTDARDNATQYIKDDFGRTIVVINPDTGTSRTQYDAAGNRIKKIDAQGHTTTYDFDAANRLVQKTDTDGSQHLSYDPHSGRLARIQTPSSTEAFHYDTEGRLIAHTRQLDDHAFTTQYAYNENGKLSEKHLPDGQTLIYHYHATGRNKNTLRAITRKDWFGQSVILGELNSQRDTLTREHYVHGNGITTEVDTDGLGHPQSRQISKKLRLSYTYDDAGNISGMEINGAKNRYDYDPLGRLTNADTALGITRYKYDKLGNRTQKQQTNQQGTRSTETYTYPDKGKGNRLIARNKDDITYTYNTAGSPTRIGDLTYGYNATQRPINVKKGSQLLAEYAYNGFGERIKKIVYRNGKTPKVTYYLYDGHRLTAEANEQGNITAQYLYYNNSPVAKLEGKTIFALHTDHLGTPRMATDDDGNIVWHADYSPFGQAQIKTQHITLNLRFPGQYADLETGTHYNYFRDYNPATGRYQTSDPLGLKGGMNSYAYVDNDPLHYIDPLGLFLLAFDGTWIDKDSDDPEKAITSNVELFRLSYEQANGPDSTYYSSGVGTDGGAVGSVLGGLFGLGGRDKINKAVDALIDRLNTSDDRTVDIVGFSRGAAMAREFANVILKKLDKKEIEPSFKIRFMGLFDSVSTGFVDGSATNSCGFLYDFDISDKVAYVAQATALNEHRSNFPLDSIRDPEATAPRVEQGFIGAHSDIGGGYNRNDRTVSENGDLSDIALQWMVAQATNADVAMDPLREENRRVTNPIVHDSGGWFDRQINFPSDPNWTQQRQPDPFNVREDEELEVIYQRDDPLYTELGQYIERSNTEDNLGKVDMATYGQWLQQNTGINVQY